MHCQGEKFSKVQLYLNQTSGNSFQLQFFKVKHLGFKWNNSKQRACPVTISSPFYHFFPICFLHAECYWETMMSTLPYKTTPPCQPLPYNAYFCSFFWLLSCYSVRDLCFWRELLDFFLLSFSYLSFIMSFKVHRRFWVWMWKILCFFANSQNMGLELMEKSYFAFWKSNTKNRSVNQTQS